MSHINRRTALSTAGGAILGLAVAPPGPAAARPALSLEHMGVKGDGGSADMDRLAAALAQSAASGRPLVPEPGKTYRFANMVTWVPGATYLGHPSSSWHFYASDAFNATTKRAPGDAAGNLIYAPNCDNLLIDTLRVVFHPVTNSYVHGLNIRGGSGGFVSRFEGTGFCSGYVIKPDSVTGLTIEDAYIHDCLQRCNLGNRGAGQLTGICWDDDKINRVGSVDLTILNPRIARLRGDAETRASIGCQTDGLNSSPLSRGARIVGARVRDVDEGFDNSGGKKTIVRNCVFMNCANFGLKALYGASDGLYENILIDGAGIAGFALGSGSQALGNSVNNLFRDITVTRIGDPSILPTPPDAKPCVFRLDDSGADGNAAQGNEIERLRAYGCIAGTGIYVSATAAFTLGNKIVDFKYDATITEPFYATAGNRFPGNTALSLDFRIDGPSSMGDADYVMKPFERSVATGVAFTVARRVHLPPARYVPKGSTVRVIDEVGTVGSTKTLIVRQSSVGNDLLNGAPSITLATAYASVTYQSDGMSRFTRVG